MNDEQRQQKFIEQLEAALAGRPAPAEAGDQPLLDLAHQLKQAAARPEPAFAAQLERRLRSQGALAEAAGGCGEVARQGWLPGWLTLPRVAALAAVLIIGLGLIGLTGALLRGYGPAVTAEKTTVSPALAPYSPDSITPQDQAGGAAPASPGGVSSTAGGDAAGRETAGTAAPAAGGETTLPAMRQVVQTADYSLEVEPGTFQERYNQISALAGKYGGYLVSAEARATAAGEIKRGRVSFRVLSSGDSFQRALTELEGLGHVTSSHISGQDVTEEYVDLESRLRNAQSQEASLLALMQKAASVNEILAVQARLDSVQSQIEQLKGRIQYLDSRADYATINVQLTESDAQEEDRSGGVEWGFIDSLRYAGWLAVQTVNFVIVALGVLLPVLTLLALAALVGSRLWRRRRQSQS